MSFQDSLLVSLEALVANKLRACLTMLGIIIGVGAVIALMAVGQDLPGLGDNVRTVISWPSVFMAFGFASAIGLFFGIYPAHRAAQLRPIDALHYE